MNYHMWDDFGVGKLVNLANCELFSNILLTDYFSLAKMSSD